LIFSFVLATETHMAQRAHRRTDKQDAQCGLQNGIHICV